MATIDEIYKKDIAFKDDFIPNHTGDFDTMSGLANVTEALYRRLITVPGSLVNRPNYGVGIKQYQNALNSLDTRRKIALAIKEQFVEDPRVTSVDGVSFAMDDNFDGKVQIQVSVKLEGYDEQTITFTPFGG